MRSSHWFGWIFNLSPSIHLSAAQLCEKHAGRWLAAAVSRASISIMVHLTCFWILVFRKPRKILMFSSHILSGFVSFSQKKITSPFKRHEMIWNASLENLFNFFCLNLSSLSCCPSWLRNARLTSTTSLADHAVRGPPYRPQSWWVHLKGYLCENSEIYKLKFSCSCSSGLGTSICKTERCFLFTAGHF